MLRKSCIKKLIKQIITENSFDVAAISPQTSDAH